MFEASRSRVIKLQEDETIKFIELYANERFLYDPTCEQYKDKQLRFAAAKRISRAMGISGFGPREVITKFKNLRSSYCQELKKIAESERSGIGTEAYVPKVIWFETMHSFIRPFVQQRPTTTTKSSLVPPNSSIWVKEESIDEISIDIPSFSESPASADTTQTPAAILKRKHSQDTNIKVVSTRPSSSVWVQEESLGESSLDISSYTESPATASASTRRPASMSKRKRTQEPSQDLQVDGMRCTIEKSEEISNRSAKPAKEDCYDFFGKYISSMLRLIGPPAAMRLQEQITSMVVREMCKPTPSLNLNQPASNMSFSGTPSHDTFSDFDE